MGFGIPELLATWTVLKSEERRFEKEKENQNIYEIISHDIRKMISTYEKIYKNLSPTSNVPAFLVDGVRFIIFYYFDIVLRKQRKEHPAQKKLMEFYFNNDDIPFTINQFLSLVYERKDYWDFYNLMEIDENKAGAFWSEFLKFVRQTGTKSELMIFIKHSVAIIRNFAVLGKQFETNIDALTDNFSKCILLHYEKTSDSSDGAEWLDNVSISDQVIYFKNQIKELFEKSMIADDIEFMNDFIDSVDTFILSSASDFVMMTRLPANKKIIILDDIIRMAKLSPIVGAFDFVREVANNTELGQTMKRMYSAGPPLNTFWETIIMLIDMGMTSKKLDQSSITSVMSTLHTIMTHIENYTINKYGDLGFDDISKKYILHIIDQVQEELKRKQEEIMRNEDG